MSSMQRVQEHPQPIAQDRSCCESGCDRHAARGDARCGLHSSRLGAVPVAEQEVQPLPSLTAAIAAEKQQVGAPRRSTASLAQLPERWWMAAAATFAATGGFWLALLAYLDTFRAVFRDTATYTEHGLALAAVIVTSVASPVLAGLAFYRANTRSENVLSWVLMVTAVLTFFTGMYVGVDRLQRPIDPLMNPAFGAVQGAVPAPPAAPTRVATPPLPEMVPQPFVPVDSPRPRTFRRH